MLRVLSYLMNSLQTLRSQQMDNYDDFDADKTQGKFTSNNSEVMKRPLIYSAAVVLKQRKRSLLQETTRCCACSRTPTAPRQTKRNTDMDSVQMQRQWHQDPPIPKAVKHLRRRVLLSSSLVRRLRGLLTSRLPQTQHQRNPARCCNQLRLLTALQLTRAVSKVAEPHLSALVLAFPGACHRMLALCGLSDELRPCLSQSRHWIMRASHSKVASRQLIPAT